jgi:hypothetical protein
MKLHKVLMLAVALLLTVGLVAWSAPAAWNGPNPQEKADEPAKDKEKEEKEEPQTEADKAKQEEMEKKACESLDTHYKTDTDKTQHPTPDAPADKALIYVVRPTMGGNKVQTKLAADGQFKGINRGNNYFFFTLEPGQHYFCSQAENKSTLSLKVEAGKTYYLQQKIKMGLHEGPQQTGGHQRGRGQGSPGQVPPQQLGSEAVGLETILSAQQRPPSGGLVLLRRGNAERDRFYWDAAGMLPWLSLAAKKFWS